MIKNIFLRTLKFCKSKLLGLGQENFIETLSLEKQLEFCPATCKIYLTIKFVARSLKTRMELDEILNNEYIISKLDNTSLKYLFYNAGLLEGLKVNDMYTIVGFDPSNPHAVIVKNTKTFQKEEWELEEAYRTKIYHKLDKESLFRFVEQYYVHKHFKNETAYIKMVK